MSYQGIALQGSGIVHFNAKKNMFRIANKKGTSYWGAFLVLIGVAIGVAALPVPAVATHFLDTEARLPT